MLIIHTIYVKESYRRRGIGERLIDRCVDELRRVGYRALYLWTEPPELTRHYASRGWHRIGKDGDGDEMMIHEPGSAGCRRSHVGVEVDDTGEADPAGLLSLMAKWSLGTLFERRRGGAS